MVKGVAKLFVNAPEMFVVPRLDANVAVLANVMSIACKVVVARFEYDPATEIDPEPTVFVAEPLMVRFP